MNVYILIFILIVLLYYSNIIEVSHYEVKSKKLPSSFHNLKILQLSDLHGKNFGHNNKYLIKKIRNENPDIIVMTGDMINNRNKNYMNFFKLSSEISKTYDTYYIFGNHEEDLNDDIKKSLKNRVENLNIKTLYNNKISIVRNNENINLYGLCFNMKYYKKPHKISEDFNIIENEKLLGKLDENSYNILLAHNPLYFDVYSKWGADLILSGHIHGGIIRLPFIGGLLSPERKFFPKYYAGRYTLNHSELIVNRGLGNTKVKLRIFNKPEISVITLKKAAKSMCNH